MFRHDLMRDRIHRLIIHIFVLSALFRISVWLENSCSLFFRTSFDGEMIFLTMFFVPTTSSSRMMALDLTTTGMYFMIGFGVSILIIFGA